MLRFILSGNHFSFSVQNGFEMDQTRTGRLLPNTGERDSGLHEGRGNGDIPILGNFALGRPHSPSFSTDTSGVATGKLID